MVVLASAGGNTVPEAAGHVAVQIGEPSDHVAGLAAGRCRDELAAHGAAPGVGDHAGQRVRADVDPPLRTRPES
jgi:hypothetical protein